VDDYALASLHYAICGDQRGISRYHSKRTRGSPKAAIGRSIAGSRTSMNLVLFDAPGGQRTYFSRQRPMQPDSGLEVYSDPVIVPGFLFLLGRQTGGLAMATTGSSISCGRTASELAEQNDLKPLGFGRRIRFLSRWTRCGRQVMWAWRTAGRHENSTMRRSTRSTPRKWFG